MRFAFLITAHNEPYVLKKLISMLDYPDNDIYLHIDLKSRAISKNELHTESAKLILLPSRNLTWGGWSQICVTLDLLAEATRNKHDYYHLISGVDLPLVRYKDMVEFFSDNYGKEFIGITPDWAEKASISQRYKLHWLWQDCIGKKKDAVYVVSRIITRLEKMIHYERDKWEKVKYYGGPSWFSITEPAAKLILSQENWIKDRFRETICCDEIFAQTVIGNSTFADKIYNKESGDPYAECLRYARFNGTSPFVLSMKDYDTLVKSNCLFARKFGTSTKEEKDLIDLIYESYK